MKILFTLLLLATAITSFAQSDRVFLLDGLIFSGRVEDVKPRYVLLSNDAWRRPKKLAMADVHHIEYSDGTSDTFSRKHIVMKREALPLTTNNIVLGSPISGIMMNGDGYAAMGMYYERLFGKDRNMSFTLPLNICFPDLNFNAYARMLATPGFLFHTNVDKRADFAFGPSILLTNANGYRQGKFSTGAMVNTRLNLRRTGFVFCVFNNFGVSYPNNQTAKLFFQLGIGLGGTF